MNLNAKDYHLYLVGLLSALVVIAVTLLLFLQSGHSHGAINMPIAKFVLSNGNGNALLVGSAYLALNKTSQERGFMNVTEFNDSCSQAVPCGILFVFSSYSRECFWMKNTYLPLNIAWLKSSSANATSISYRPTMSAIGVPQNITPICAFGDAVLETPRNETLDDFNLNNLSAGTTITTWLGNPT